MDRLRAYWWTTGALLLLWGIGGLVLSALGRARIGGAYLSFDAPLDILHVALGALAVGIGFARLSEAASKRVALGLGTLLLALAVLGSLSPTLFSIPAALRVGVRLQFIENMAHLALGAWGAYVATN